MIYEENAEILETINAYNIEKKVDNTEFLNKLHSIAKRRKFIDQNPKIFQKLLKGIEKGNIFFKKLFMFMP